ncbi:type IX secretion system membrane protein PorP/SprF [Fulvivirgaceae bacterium BMA12]|uniref:Type IX secretion system membrane protein PorP/SprF n=1 Tax=Agaribacillus aureus TaxID=3051825 RepID=A0ABT8L5P0_9BACT|nr:type IX secretion system membrane protein PorP/SprF [Fulvivirgaceae bacterium BMA12]
MNFIKRHIDAWKKIGGLAVALAFMPCFATMAQQLGQFTQYRSNGLVINPAYAGADRVPSLTFVNRSQWSGIDGAPATQTFSAHSLFKKEHFGLGMIIINDKIGIHSNLNALGVYSYRIKFNRDTYLSMGIQMGMNRKRSDYASLATQTQVPNDPKLSSLDVAQTSFEFGTGIYIKSPKFEVGLSAPKLFPAKSAYSDSVTLELNRSHYFLLARYLSRLSHNMEIQPGLLVKHLPGLPLSVDLNMDLIFKKVILMGLSYRSYGSINSILQAKITPQLRFGYSFDSPVAKNAVLDGNSHELMVNYIFKFSNHRISGSR